MALARAARVEDRDRRVRRVARRRRASSSRSADRPTGPQRGSGTASLTPSPGLSEGSWTPSASSTPGHGSWREQQVAVEVDVVAEARDLRAGRDRRGPTRSCSRASRRARARRAACAIRTASRIPPDFASLMLTPCARSAHAGDVGGRVAVLVDEDRDAASVAFSSGPSGSPAGSGCSQYSTPSSSSCGQRLERLVERPALVHVDHAAAASRDARAPRARARRRARRRPPSFSFSRLNPPATAPRSAWPCRPGRRARSSTRSAARPGAGRGAATPARPVSLPWRSCRLRRSPPRAAGSYRRETRLDLLERPRIVAQGVRLRLEVRERRLGRLSVVRDRRRLAVARDAVVLELDVDDVRGVLQLREMTKRLGQLERSRSAPKASSRAPYLGQILKSRSARVRSGMRKR